MPQTYKGFQEGAFQCLELDSQINAGESTKLLKIKRDQKKNRKLIQKHKWSS